MAKYKVVHHINQFLAGIGGEEKADHMPEVRQGAVGPGRGPQIVLGSNYEIAATVICGDNYFGENPDAATNTVIEMVKEYGPDVFVAGPTFNTGRYGVACGMIYKAVEERLMIPVITGMYKESPGVDAFRKDLLTVSIPNSVAGMPKVFPVISALVKKPVQRQEILGPSEEGYFERGTRVSYFAEKRGSERAVEMLVKRLKGEAFETDLPMPKFDRVEPVAPIRGIKKARIAVVTSGGIAPTGNPDHVESSNVTGWGKHDMTGMDRLSPDGFTSTHGGYGRQFTIADPNVVVPLDALRELGREGESGELVNYFCTTTGTRTVVVSAARFGIEIGKMSVDEHVDGVILVST